MMLDPITWWPIEMNFFPSVVVHLSMWSPAAPIGSVDNLGYAIGSPRCFWRILTPEQCHIRMPVLLKEASILWQQVPGHLAQS